jgi:hypothetical protein
MNDHGTPGDLQTSWRRSKSSAYVALIICTTLPLAPMQSTLQIPRA